MNPTAPSGQQFTITHGDQRAVLVEVGGGLRTYGVAAGELLDGYGEDERCTGARGLPLIPWPNRLQDGRYHFDGTDYQVPLTEPDLGNAIHGFLRWRNWAPRDVAAHAVTLGIVLHPMMGYPFTLDVAVTYRLGEDGLTVTTTARNRGTSACPYAAGQHPYLALGTSTVDDLTVTLDAASWLPTDERGLPTGVSAVAGSPYDFRTARRIGGTELNYAFTDLARDAEGRATLQVSAPEGHGVQLWVDEGYRYLQLYTADTQPPPHHRTGLGAEPMTCAPNGFRSGDGLHRLEPGEAHTTRWGLRAV